MTSNLNGTHGISVIVPVFNAYTTLNELADRIIQMAETITDQFEIILVNDGSRDDSWKIICELAAQFTQIKGINLLRNYGQHHALLCGLIQAKYPTSITLDDDLQNPPEEIPKLLSQYYQGNELVYGVPNTHCNGFYRSVGSIVIRKIFSLLVGSKVGKLMSSFRVFKTDLREGFRNFRATYISLDVLLVREAQKVGYVIVQHNSRSCGKSNYSISRLISLAFNIVFESSVLPLRIASIVGLIFSLMGLFVLIYIGINYFIVGQRVEGFTFLASIISIFSGAQLLSLGIIGEYLGRVHFGLMNYPPYVVCQTVNFEGKEHAN